MTDGTPGAAPIEAALGALLPPGAVGVVWAAGERVPADRPTSANRRAATDARTSTDLNADALPPDELAAVRNAVPSRRAEFARGRACAREALRRLGGVSEPIVIPMGSSRAPVWPAGATGSITHCAGLVAAAVARVGAVTAIGIDAEPARPLPPGVRNVVLTPAERARRTPDLMETVSFSAKEAIHKAIHPRTDVWLDFQDVELAFDEAGGTFRAAMVGAAAAAPGSRALDRLVGVADLIGRYAIMAGFVFTVAYQPGGEVKGVGR